MVGSLSGLQLALTQVRDTRAQLAGQASSEGYELVGTASIFLDYGLKIPAHLGRRGAEGSGDWLSKKAHTNLNRSVGLPADPSSQNVVLAKS